MTETVYAHYTLVTLAVLILASICSPAPMVAVETAPRPPNVIIIFTDDQGYGDVGCYGAKGYDTPHLDRLASDGMRFTDFYSVASYCSPSRAALLTGCYPVRVNVPRVLFPHSTTGLDPDEVTIADLLRSRDYATACIGKWHLGHLPEFLPVRQGFDSYFGIPYSNDMTPDPRKNPSPSASQHPPLPLVRDLKTIETEPDQSQLTRRYTQEALHFIKSNQHRPFFLYLPHTFPHVPLYVSERYAGKNEAGLYGDVIAEIDWSVGQITAALNDLDLDHQTLVIFTSDNGPWLIKGAHGGSAGPLREGKGTSFDGGHRVPCIMRWPGKIPAGHVCRAIATTMDLLPTIACIAGAAVPPDRDIDGQDIGPLLFGEQVPCDFHKPVLFYLASDPQAVRWGKWKLHVPHRYNRIRGSTIATDTDPGEYAVDKMGVALFDLEADIGETTNVADAHPHVVQRLTAIIEDARGDSRTWRQGKNKTMRPPKASNQ